MKVKSSISLLVAAMALLAFSLPIQASDTDDRIEEAAKESYVFKTYLKDDDIKIKSNDGVVTLTGTVAEESHKSLAGETVANQSGVKSVNNKLEIKGDLPAEKSDAWLLTKVKTTLLYHSSVSGFQTEVDVKDGIVTLRGEADNQAQKDLTAKYAADVEGVKNVNNQMTVAKTAKEARTASDKIDDASITALVKMSLLYHRSTSGLQTKVETKDGIVTLSGKVDSEAGKDLATQYAKDVSGVKEVKNLMTIE
ncbi:MAG: BON domain-containing protein [Desulfuromonadales bacterium]|nr:BON domain-containing protein [Desulfuromonadales bacterium]MDW7758185.1 BON domain-containing protein [Desulfuromonadales bacterium]